jgi:hypothetical protein
MEVALIIIFGLACAWAGAKLKQRAMDAANEAKLEAQKVLSEAKTEYEKLRLGVKHRLDQILG